MSVPYVQLEEELEALKKEYTALTLEIPRDETYAQQLERHLLNGRIAGIKYALGVMETFAREELAKTAENLEEAINEEEESDYDGLLSIERGFADGVHSTVSYLFPVATNEEN